MKHNKRLPLHVPEKKGGDRMFIENQAGPPVQSRIIYSWSLSAPGSWYSLRIVTSSGSSYIS